MILVYGIRPKYLKKCAENLFPNILTSLIEIMVYNRIGYKISTSTWKSKGDPDAMAREPRDSIWKETQPACMMGARDPSDIAAVAFLIQDSSTAHVKMLTRVRALAASSLHPICNES